MTVVVIFCVRQTLPHTRESHLVSEMAWEILRKKLGESNRF